ncbi:tRNA-(ms[2]io[6]A)-hydroxylase [Reichenbachiella agariperforans]|uniref:tRNA-(Ms[2]io[6]A)-hydroxylase n=1 Tax=Reichenbachiella agariperforans TaxID=156994 RepID=A0A1M6KNK2_REIAG|nr:tRNA-(ms[2]io[6]A)-hydroxylase [Reichenbachiella agariperforans]MBU2913628.1 tRNA-(ms[2]io[6]A)-hydroxylase [Reichenbachiella agariperforans]SHJ60563.1 tRNA-(ms[2]io[6]A)-hydroxylase [Reichenbachiella agariperforans]
MDKTTLGLNLPTDPRWANVSEMDLAEILIDHAYCEQKAASSGISLIVTYPERTELVEVMTDLVAEEWGHFERVLEKMKARGITLGRKRNDEYVAAISKISKSGGSRDEQLVEKLLLNALIEARSCERFKLLWKNIGDEDLSKFYYELMISEAGHYHTFLDLAKKYKGEEYTMTRWAEILEKEAEIIQKLEVRSDRMH